jgi:hypothetical protein
VVLDFMTASGAREPSRSASLRAPGGANVVAASWMCHGASNAHRCCCGSSARSSPCEGNDAAGRGGMHRRCVLARWCVCGRPLARPTFLGRRRYECRRPPDQPGRGSVDRRAPARSSLWLSARRSRRSRRPSPPPPSRHRRRSRGLLPGHAQRRPPRKQRSTGAPDPSRLGTR